MSPFDAIPFILQLPRKEGEGEEKQEFSLLIVLIVRARHHSLVTSARLRRKGGRKERMQGYGGPRGGGPDPRCIRTYQPKPFRERSTSSFLLRGGKKKRKRARSCRSTDIGAPAPCAHGQKKARRSGLFNLRGRKREKQTCHYLDPPNSESRGSPLSTITKRKRE